MREQRPDSRQRTEIIWVPTWRCQLRCPYCDYRIEKTEGREGCRLFAFGETWDFDRELRWPEWIVCLNRFRPYHLELTGGEPLMYRDLPDLLAHIPADSSWAITSNTLLDVRAIEPANCRFWTASFHYHSTERFLQNVSFLMRRGFPLRVTLVITPENQEDFFAAVKLLREREIMVNIHPMLKQGFSWADHGDLLERVRALHDGIWVVFVDDVPKGWEARRHSLCSAGGRYFSLMPDGSVLRCYSAILWRGLVGHVVDYEPTKFFLPCGNDCMFPCDLKPEKG